MNYKYRLVDVDFVLSNEEHEKVTNSVAAGNNNVFLREGTLMINMAFVRTISKTDEMTSLKEKDKQEKMRFIEPPREQIRGGGFGGIKDIIQNQHFPFYKRMGWEHNLDCVCKRWEVEITR